MERRLSAILSADVVGYSRLMAEDEEETLRILTAYREQLTVLVRQHRGRVVNAPGDALLAEFRSALDATRCALEIQRVVGARNQPLADDRRMEFRIGIHLGDVMVDGEEIYGSGVNIAARLEGLAEPGSVCISGPVHEQVGRKLELEYVDLGAQSVKNIPDPVHVYRLEQSFPARPVSAAPRSRRLRTALAAGTAAVLLVAGSLWASWPRPLGLVIELVGAGAPPVDPELPEKPSIVVLPFANMSADPEQEYFADGISEDLTTVLSRNHGLFVISRNSAFTYKGQATKVEDVARELGVRYVLEGSVRRESGSVRVTVQLIDATSGFHVWSKRYDRELVDIFVLQSELAEAIQAELQVSIRDAEMARVRRGGTADVDAYDAMIRGLSHFEQLRRDDNLEARRWFERAIELDPDFGSAHAMYGLSFAMEYNMGWNRDAALLQRAEESARAALELGDQSADAFNALGSIALARRDFDAASRSYEQAIEAEPSHDIAHLGRGVALAAQGRPLPALASISRGLRLNPKGTAAQRIMVGMVNHRAGRIAEAVALFEAARAENPDLVLPRLMLIVQRDSEGRLREARTLAEEVLRINSGLSAAEASRSLIGFEGEALFRRAGLP